MSPLTDTIKVELQSFDFGLVNQDPSYIADCLQKFVEVGSRLHSINVSDLVVFYHVSATPVYEVDSSGNKVEVLEIGTTIKELLLDGAKFFDALFWLSLPVDDRPTPLRHPAPSKGHREIKFPRYDNPGTIAKNIFVLFFYILIRGHAPSDTGANKGQPMPKFISGVLGYKESADAVGEYLASFGLAQMEPGWVRHLDLKRLGQEASSRLGLGVAGYRYCSVFNTYEPDKMIPLSEEEEEENAARLAVVGTAPGKGGPKLIKPHILAATEHKEAIAVAKSFQTAGLCWDFHPATRSPNILTKYGNVNKNCANLILQVYTDETINEMVAAKKLAVKPILDRGTTEYKQWAMTMMYKATSPIF